MGWIVLLVAIGILEYLTGIGYYFSVARFDQIAYFKQMSERMLKHGHFRLALFYVTWAEHTANQVTFFKYMHGLALYRLHQYAMAMYLFETAKREAPSYDQIDNIIGDTYIQLEAYSQAKPFLDQYLLRNPDNIYARLNLAIAEYRTNHSDAAMRTLDQVLNLDPENVMALKLKGSICAKYQQYELALQTLMHFNELGGDDPTVHMQIMRIYRNQKAYTLCSQYAQALLEKGKEHPEYYVHLGDALCHLGMLKKGAAMLHQAVQMDDHQAEGHYLLAKLMAITHHKTEALMHLSKAISEHPKYILQAKDDDDFNNLRFFRDFYRLVDQPGV